MTTLTAASAKVQFLNLLSQADILGERFTITRNGKPCAILMSNDEYEGLIETFQIFQDQDLTQKLLKSVKASDQGTTLSFDSVVGRKQKR